MQQLDSEVNRLGKQKTQRSGPAILLALGFVLTMSGSATANTEQRDYSLVGPDGSKSASWWERSGTTNNLRYSIDGSNRSIFFGHRDELGFQHAVGLDLHKVFSGDNGDIGTLTVQGYLTRIDNLPVHPGFFDDDDDTDFVYRIVNFNYTGFGGGIPNIRVGHVEIPFGLEHTINTNGTLRDYNNGRSLGVKADWGVTLNDELAGFEYEFAASSGGGQEIDSQNGSYVYSGRIGTLRERDQVFGLSFYKAELGGIERRRVGVDAQFYFGLHGVFAELSAGDNGNSDVFNAQLEWNVRNSNEAWLTYVQLQRFAQKFNRGWDDNLAGVVGVRFQPDGHWDFSGQVKQDFTGFEDALRETTVSLQIRYRM